MKNASHKHLVRLFLLIVFSIVIRFGLMRFLNHDYPSLLRLIACFFILGSGVIFVLKKAADVIEETTEVLSERTKIASGLLQSLGTAFPDMALGVVAAIISLKLRSSDMQSAINYAIIAASTTFGSNIYNVGHAAWCVFRQNVANKVDQTVAMMPGIKHLGTVKPMKQHKNVLGTKELNISLDAINALTILTSIVAITMVLFGRITDPALVKNGDIYQLIRPIGLVILIVCVLVMYYFRKSQHQLSNVPDIEKEERFFEKQSNWFIFINLLLAGIAILFTAEAMIQAIEVFCEITKMPLVVAGALSGIIGCLGEMIVVHDFTIHPNGRLGDALMGVAMDNIVTTFGAAVVAVMGGIFLGGSSLIMIFVIILGLNTTLMWQISKLQPYTKS